MVLRMSGRRLRIFLASSVISGMRAVGRPEHPVFQLAPGLFERVSEQGAEGVPLSCQARVELALGVRVPQCREGFVLIAVTPAGHIPDVWAHTYASTALLTGMLARPVDSTSIPAFRAAAMWAGA